MLRALPLASKNARKTEEMMKASFVLAVCLALAPIGVNAQTNKTNAAAATKIDPAKEADIRRLLDLVGQNLDAFQPSARTTAR